MIVKNNGKKANIFACIGSAGAGFNFCCIHIETPIATGHAPIIKKFGTASVTLNLDSILDFAQIKYLRIYFL